MHWKPLPRFARFELRGKEGKTRMKLRRKHKQRDAIGGDDEKSSASENDKSGTQHIGVKPKREPSPESPEARMAVVEDEGRKKKKKKRKKKKTEIDDGEGASSASKSDAAENGKIQIKDTTIVSQEGDIASIGNKVGVQYRMYYDEEDYGDCGTGEDLLIQSTKGKNFEFRIGNGEAIAGLDIGVRGMRIGNTREIRIPPEYGFGEVGYPPQIPGDTALFMVVTLKSISVEPKIFS